MNVAHIGCISVCLLWQGRQTAAWMIHKSRGVTPSTILQARFLASHAHGQQQADTQERPQRGVCDNVGGTYSGMKGMKVLRRK